MIEVVVDAELEPKPKLSVGIFAIVVGSVDSFSAGFSAVFSASVDFSSFFSVTVVGSVNFEAVESEAEKFTTPIDPPIDFVSTVGENETFFAVLAASTVSLVYSVVVLLSPSPTQCNIRDNFSLSMLLLASVSMFDGFSFGFTKLILNSSSSSSSLRFRRNFARKLGGGGFASTLKRRSFLTAVGCGWTAAGAGCGSTRGTGAV